MKLFLENVRSFEGWHEIPITPATVLLGENSSGKSTLLAMLSVVTSDGFPFNGNVFNQFPFELGGFKTIATNKRGVKHFTVGFETRIPNHFRFHSEFNKSAKYIECGLICVFTENNGLPIPCEIVFWLDKKSILFSEKLNDKLSYIHAEIVENKKIENTISYEFESANQQGLQFPEIQKKLIDQLRSQKSSKNLEEDEFIEFIFRLFISGRFNQIGDFSSIAFAPVRSRPRRTYDQLSDERSSEGDHVPLLLARAIDPNNKQAASLHNAIQSFGEYSEMFNDIVVKQLGKGSGDPFQVQVKKDNQKTNMLDVGYGVSQVLPLIVDAERAVGNKLLLLQQPEVHLHPKAQAALGSLIKDWVGKGKKVVVETHSDYLVDRLRLEVKREKLKHEQLTIYFLDQKNKQTTVHKLDVDKEGNILNAPEGYRDFFLREQMALLMGD